MKVAVPFIIRFFRGIKQQSQAALAAESKMNLRHFQNIEYGRVDVKCCSIQKIAHSLQVPACYLAQDPKEIIEGFMGCRVDLLDQLPFPITLINFDGKYLYSNQAGLDYLEFDRKLMRIGKYHVSDLAIDGQHVERIREKISHVKKTTPPIYEPVQIKIRSHKSRRILHFDAQWVYASDHVGHKVGILSWLRPLSVKER